MQAVQVLLLVQFKQFALQAVQGAVPLEKVLLAHCVQVLLDRPKLVLQEVQLVPDIEQVRQGVAQF